MIDLAQSIELRVQCEVTTMFMRGLIGAERQAEVADVLRRAVNAGVDLGAGYQRAEGWSEAGNFTEGKP